MGNNLLVAGVQWNALYGNDAKTGEKLWAVSDNGLRNRGASPAMHGALLYLISDKSFFILEAATGKVIVRNHQCITRQGYRPEHRSSCSMFPYHLAILFINSVYLSL